ncbi:MAG: hypothetical protein WAL91_03190 [Propionicimonas sp.]
MIRFDLPSTDDLIRLGQPHPDALSIYLPTAPTPAGRELAFATAKSAVDDAVRRLRDAGRSPAIQEALREQWTAVAGEDRIWSNLAASLVIFLSPDFAEEYVLPNDLEQRVHLGDYFDLNQLVRTVTMPQRAYALTLSSNGWNLWEATATTRARELELVGEHAEDAAEATNRSTIRGRKLLRRLGGDEGQKVLLERYAQVVADAVREELGRLDPKSATPLFVFANEPLLSLLRSQELPWSQVSVPGAPDELRPDQIDAAIRERIGKLTSATLSAEADRIGNHFASGLAVTDLAQLARAAVAGAVGKLFYNMSEGALGFLDDADGSISYDAERGYDLLSRIAVHVLRNGGDVVAVRPAEITAQIWNGKVLAELRHPLV